MTSTVAEHLRSITGSAWTTEGTGGGCEALTTRLEGGIVLVITDDNLCTPQWGSEGWNLGAYTVDAWSDGDDALTVDTFSGRVSPVNLRNGVTTLLGALPTLAKGF